jgi:hypothetical protein
MEGNSEGAKKLNGEIQKRIRKDKENYLREKCRELEEHNKKVPTSTCVTSREHWLLWKVLSLIFKII